MKYILYAIVAVIVLVMTLFLFTMILRFYHNYKRKRESKNTYAIQNVKTGMDIRPYNAGIYDKTKIIQYKHANWECLTWQMIKLENNTYLLKNLYTQKTIQPSALPEQGVGLYQLPLEANRLQYWEFIKQSNETYLIKLKGTELYITTTSDNNNSSLVLMPQQNSKEQLWKLLEQHPIY